MLSILIPTYNYNVVNLVKQLYKQVLKEGVEFEIIVLDDASTNKIAIKDNHLINNLDYCVFQELSENIGRSKIRNLLSEKAQYKWLLFLDSDTEPTQNTFIKKYIDSIKEGYSIVFGGIHYKGNNQENCSLRHLYGIKRESISLQKRNKKPFLSFITMAFLIKKEVFKTVIFSDNLFQYGYEDTVFALQLRKNNFQILHIDNTITHLNLETNHEFIEKTKISLKNLIRFNQSKEIEKDDIKLLKVYYYLKSLKLIWLIKLFFKTSRRTIIIQLKSKNPNLFLFDLYRLGYFCLVKTNK
jgi:GT2 family glycosyltransferase